MTKLSESRLIRFSTAPVLVNNPNVGTSTRYTRARRKISCLLIVTVKFTLYGPALVLSMISMTVIPVDAREMRRTVTVETLSTHA
jgi:hypothetical protein